MRQWVTVETLSPETMSVASVGDAPRDFADVRRVLQRLLSKVAELHGSITTRRIADAIRAAHDRSADMNLAIPTRSGAHRLIVRPVFGPTRAVHAVRLWLGPAAEPVPQPRPAAGLIWRAGTQMIHLPEHIERTFGIAGRGVSQCSIAELFQHVSGFSRHAEVLDVLYGRTSSDKLQFDVVVTGSAGPGCWRITMRARDGEPGGEAWWLVEDVTSDTMSSARPILEQVALREAHRRAGTHLAILHLPNPSISHWLTDPAPWIRWSSLGLPVEVFHPDDRAELTGLTDRLHSGGSAEITVRTLSYGGTYIRTSLALYPYPGYSNRQLTIAQFIGGGGEAITEIPCETALFVSKARLTTATATGRSGHPAAQ